MTTKPRVHVDCIQLDDNLIEYAFRCPHCRQGRKSVVHRHGGVLGGEPGERVAHCFMGPWAGKTLALEIA